MMMGWSPDGKRLLFASDRRGAMDLWALPVADGKPQGAPELVKPDIMPWPLGVTTSGTLYFGVTLSDTDIEVASLDFNTGKLLSPPVRPVQSYIGYSLLRDWSPDGKSLAYVSTRVRGVGFRVLAIRSLETGQVRELRPSLRTFDGARWAPDGRSFLGMGTDFNGRQGLYRIDAQTGEVAPIAFSPAGSPFSRPLWAPDGKKIYYVSFLPKTNEASIRERDLASGSEREVVRRASLGAPSVSPDGRYIAARSSDPSTKSSTVLVFPIAGGEPRELLRVNPPQHFGFFVPWTPDGQGVIVSKFRDDSDRGELWLVPVADGQPRKLDLDTRILQNMPIRVHPDGRQIAYMAGEHKLEVWVLENFLPPAAKKQ
jgi:Tol biopolymer transport system component